MSYADKRHTDTQTHRHTDIHTDQTLKMWISDSGDHKGVSPSKSPFRKFDPKRILFLLIGKRK